MSEPRVPRRADGAGPAGDAAPTSLTGTARVGRRAAAVAGRLRTGDIAVLDHPDLDPTAARALLDAGVAAVVNTDALVSGRFPSAGPQVLAEAGVLLVDQVGDEAHGRIVDGRELVIDGAGVLRLGADEVGRGRVVGLEEIRRELQHARSGLVAHLDTFTASASDFLRREQDLLLNGAGLPQLRTAVDGRPVVVVGRAGDHRAELRAVRRFVAEQDPVLIAVDKAADDLHDAGLRADVVVVSPEDPANVPSANGLRAAADVVVRFERGDPPGMLDTLRGLGADPLRCETTASAEDVALLLAAAGHAEIVVGVGLHADLDELLDHRRAALASTYLTRLRLGHTLVDAPSVSQLYSGRTRAWHVLVVLLAGWLALVAAIAVTPVGQEWLTRILDTLQGLFS